MAKEPHSTDSTRHAEDRRAKMQAEYKKHAEERAAAEEQRQVQKEQQDQAAQKAEAEYLEQQADAVQGVDTREMLLERIRKLREDKPVPVARVAQRSEGMMQVFTAEQEAGRAAVAKAEAEATRIRDLRMLRESERKAREGDMVSVVHPNPMQEEQFPASKATLGKTK